MLGHVLRLTHALQSVNPSAADRCSRRGSTDARRGAPVHRGDAVSSATVPGLCATAHALAAKASAQFARRRWQSASSRCDSASGRSSWQLTACCDGRLGQAGVQESRASAAGVARRRRVAAARSNRRSHLHRRQASAHTWRAPQVGQRISPRFDWHRARFERSAISRELRY